MVPAYVTSQGGIIARCLLRCQLATLLACVAS